MKAPYHILKGEKSENKNKREMWKAIFGHGKNIPKSKWRKGNIEERKRLLKIKEADADHVKLEYEILRRREDSELLLSRHKREEALDIRSNNRKESLEVIKFIPAVMTVVGAGMMAYLKLKIAQPVA